MLNIQSKSYQYKTLKGTLPYAYGIFTPRVLLSRTYFLFNVSQPDISFIADRLVEWQDMNSTQILTAYKAKKTDSVIVHLPFQSISLTDAIQEGYITLKRFQKNSDLQVIIHPAPIKFINWNHLFRDVSRELLLTITVGATKQILEFLNLGFNRTIALQCALVLGLVKGLTKSVSDQIIYNKKITFTKMLLKCLIDIFSEVATVLFIDLLYQQPNPAYKSAIKGFFKYFFKHLSQRILILMTTFKLSPQTFRIGCRTIFRNHIYAIFGQFITLTELILEISKASFKGMLRAYGYEKLGPFFGPMVGSIFGATLINIFVDQCSLSYKHN